MTKLSIFATVTQTNVGKEISMLDAFQRIRTNPKQRELIQEIRGIKDKKQQDLLKKRLPVYTWSGIFSQRNAASIQEHSGLICLDFDEEKLQNIMRKPEFILCCFLSPRGTGYKVIIRIPPSIEEHGEYFDSLKDYFDLPTLDIKAKDISRACFDSYDPNIYINLNAPVFLSKSVITHIVDKKQETTSLAFTCEDPDRIMRYVLKGIEKSASFRDGRNNFIHLLASDLNRFGIPESQAYQFCCQYQEKDFTTTEIETTVRSAYKRTNEFDTKRMIDKEPIHYARTQLHQSKPSYEIQKDLETKYGINPAKANHIIDEASKNADDIFWTEYKRDGKPYFKIDKQLLRDFYVKNGIHRYKLNNQTWMIVQVLNGIVKEITIDNIRDIIREHFEKLPKEIDGTRKSIIQQAIEDQLDANYLKPEKIAWLPYLDINWQKDDRRTAYFYFQNKALEITGQSLKEIEYINLPNCIWQDQIIPRDFHTVTDLDFNHNEFLQFIDLIGCAGQYCDNFQMLCNTIGYILHSYKDPSNPKAIILTDEVISDNPEGGIGKGVFIKGIAHIKNLITFDGKNWSWNKSFLFQRIQLSTQVMVWEDVSKSFNFEKLFSIITEGVEVEKKNKDTFKIEYPDSPKVMLTSNYVVNGQGASHDRRRHEIELKQFFSPKYTPRDHFGHNLYDDWDQYQWQLFDNFMMSCVHDYLRDGLVRTKPNNLNFKKLLNTVPEEFINWYNDFIPVHELFKCSEKTDEFKAAFPDHSKISVKQFTKWLSEVSKYNGQELEKKHLSSGTWVRITVKSEGN
jgi:transcriptional regulator CtsR